MRPLSFLATLALATFLCLPLVAQEPQPFHWQWQKMQEDNFWRRPIIRQMNASRVRLAIVDAEVKAMGAFGDKTDVELQDMAFNESYQWVDLDGDGKPELITGGFGVDQCGGTGNCLLHVFRRHGNQFQLILSGTEERMMIDRSGPKPLLVLYTHGSASEGSLYVYSFPSGTKARLEHAYDVTWGDLTHAYRSPHLDPITR